MSNEKILSEEEQNLYLKTALKAGQIALENGAETARCEEIMHYVLSDSGETDFETSIVSTSIFARFGEKTRMTTIKNWSTNLSKMSTANDLSRRLYEKKIDIEEASLEFEKIDLINGYKLLIQMLGYCMITTAMPVLLKGNMLDLAVSFVTGILLALISSFFSRMRIHPFASVFAQTFLIALYACIAVILTKGLVDIDINTTAAIIPMVPGLALTNAVRDALQGDYVSGAGRLMETIVKTLALTLGIIAGILVFMTIPVSWEISMLALPHIESDGVLQYVLYFAAAVIFCSGFCIIFNVPKKYIIWGALTGGIGKIIYILLINFDFGPIAATFIATVVIALLAHVNSRIFKEPTILFLISGIMALVPGSLLYKSIYTIMAVEHVEGAKQLMETLFIAGAIAFAIFFVDAIFQAAKKIKNKELMD